MNRFLFIALLILNLQGSAQTRYTLQQCIDTALANNIPLKQSALQMEVARISWKQSRSNQLPNLGMTVTHGVNSGRSIDPFSNSYVNQSVNRAGYNIGSEIILFSGGALQNRIKENAVGYEAARMEWQQAKDILVLNVMLAYLQVLNQEDAVQLWQKQVETGRKVLDRLELLDNKGAVRPSDVTDLKGQWINDQVNLLDAKQALASAKLILLQWMNKPYDALIQLERINSQELTGHPDLNTEEIYLQSLQHFPAIKAVELRTKSALIAVRATKAQRYPQLSFGAELNTNYSSLARDGGQNKISYGSQLKNNRFSSIGLGLSIPIFNASTVRNRITLSEINYSNTRLAEEESRRQLRQWIEEAYLNMENSYQRQLLLKEQVTALKLSYNAAEVRFNSGVGTSVDYLLARERLDRAEVNLLSARYDYVLRIKVLNFYRGSN